MVVIAWARTDNRFSATAEFGGNTIKLSDLKELMVQGVRMACYSIKRVISKLKNISARSTAIQTPESSGNLSDESSRGAGNNGEKRGLIKLVL